MEIFSFPKNILKKITSCLIYRGMYFVHTYIFPLSLQQKGSSFKIWWQFSAIQTTTLQQLLCSNVSAECSMTWMYFYLPCFLSLEWKMGSELYQRFILQRGNRPSPIGSRLPKSLRKFKMFSGLQVIWLIKLKTLVSLVICQFWESCMLPVACADVLLEMLGYRKSFASGK